jgi:hypothetical protein
MTTPTTVEVAAILLGYLMLGEKCSAHEITGALAIGSAAAVDRWAGADGLSALCMLRA